MRPDWKTWRHAIDHRNRWFPSVPIYDKLPEGWHIVHGTRTQPRGTCWIATNGSLFDPEHKRRHALMWK